MTLTSVNKFIKSLEGQRVQEEKGNEQVQTTNNVQESVTVGSNLPEVKEIIEQQKKEQTLQKPITDNLNVNNVVENIVNKGIEQPQEQQQEQQQEQPQKEQPQKEQQQQQEQKPIDENLMKSLDTDIDSLLSDIKDLNIKKKEVNTNDNNSQFTQDKIENKLENTDITLAEKEEVVTYITELETKNAQKDMELRQKTIEIEQLNKLLEQNRSKQNEFFDKTKELEWEQKKMKTTLPPTEMTDLLDYYKLAKENPSIYNKRNAVGELIKHVEQFTNLNLDSYILDWLKSGDNFNKEENSGIPNNNEVKNNNERAKEFIEAITF